MVAQNDQDFFSGKVKGFPSLERVPYIKAVFDHAVECAFQHKSPILALEHLVKALLDDAEFETLIQSSGGSLEIFEGSISAAIRQKFPELWQNAPFDLTPVVGGVLQNLSKWVALSKANDDDVVRHTFFNDVVAAFGASPGVEAAVINCGAESLLFNQQMDQLSPIFDHQSMHERIPSKPKVSDKSSPREKAAEKANEEHRSQVDAALIDLRRKAEAGEIDLVTGRDDLIRRVMQALKRRRKSSVILYGEPGVGKTAIAEGIALALCTEYDDAPMFRDRPFYSLDLPDLVAGTKFRGDFEARMKILIDKLKSERAIVFIDEFHMIVGSGSTEGRGMDGANVLKTALGRGEITIIGATTPTEMRQLRRDGAMMRRFEPISIPEMTCSEVRSMLENACAPYAEYHRVCIDESALDAIVDTADRFIPFKAFPDKAFDLLDIACVNASEAMNDTVLPCHVRGAAERLKLRVPKKPSAEDIAAIDHIRAGLIEEIGFNEGIVSELLRSARTAILNVRSDRTKLLAAVSTIGHEMYERVAEIFASSLNIPLVSLNIGDLKQPGMEYRLVGLPQSQGLDKTGQLVEIADTHQEYVLCIKGYNEASSEIKNIMRGVLETGVVRSADGRQLEFSNAWVFLGFDIPETESGPIGFAPHVQNATRTDMNSGFDKELQPLLDVAVRVDISKEAQLEAFVRRELSSLKSKYQAELKGLVVSEDLIDRLVALGSIKAIRREIGMMLQSHLIAAIWEPLHSIAEVH